MSRRSALLVITTYLSTTLPGGGAICSEGLPPSVVYAHEHSGVHYVYNNTERTLLAMDNIDAFDYWYKGRIVAWYNYEPPCAPCDLMICRVPENETLLNGISKCSLPEARVVLTHEGSSVRDMAFDWVHSLLFYVTYTCSYTYDIVFDGGRMFVVDLRTMQSRILTDNDLHEPGALAVDPSLGLLFWTDTAVRRVDRSGMDGSQRTRFPSRYGDYKIQWVSSLALDLAERRVYWADGESPRGVYSTDYHGSNFRTVLQSSFRGDPRLIAISAEWLVWTTSYAIWATSKCSNESVALEQRYKPTSVRVFDPLTQPEMENVCEGHACRREEFCLPKPRLGLDFNGTDAEEQGGYLYTCLTANGTRLHPSETVPEKPGLHNSSLVIILLLVVGLPALVTPVFCVLRAPQCIRKLGQSRGLRGNQALSNAAYDSSSGNDILNLLG